MLLPYFAFSVSMKAWDEIELQRVVKESFYSYFSADGKIASASDHAGQLQLMSWNKKRGRIKGINNSTKTDRVWYCNISCSCCCFRF